MAKRIPGVPGPQWDIGFKDALKGKPPSRSGKDYMQGYNLVTNARRRSKSKTSVRARKVLGPDWDLEEWDPENPDKD